MNLTSRLRGELGAALFVLRTVLGMLLALWVAFRFDLSSPGSAAVTVSIIALPQAGMVLEKSFYRVLGTLLGAAVTLVILAVLVQHRNAFIVCVALWIGFCTAAASWFRGFQAYGWLLCGYTTCLVGFPAFMDAGHALDIAVDRVTIVGVGILCAGVVNAAILPERSADTLVRLIRRSFADFVAYADAATRAGGGPAVGSAQHRFSRDLAELEALRASSVFEDPVQRIRSERLSGFLGSLMFASSRLHLLHRQLDDLERRGCAAVLSVLEPLLGSFRAALRTGTHVPASAIEARPIPGQLQEFLREWPGRDRAAAAALEGGRDLRSALAATSLLLQEAAEEALSLGAVYADMPHAQSRQAGVPRARFHVASDWFLAVMGGARAMVVMLITCAFWIVSAGPEGFSATLLSAVGCALFASMPNPSRAARQMCEGFVLGFPALLVCYTWVLPAADGFGMLALGLTPFLVLGAWLMSRPDRMIFGSGYFLMFLTGLNLSASMSYDFIGMFNNALALLVGIGVAGLSLAVLVPADPDWRRHRAVRVLLRSLELARDGGARDLRARFESRVRGLSVQLMALQASSRTAPEDESLGLVVLEVGDAILRLRGIDGYGGIIDAAVRAVGRRDGAALEALDRQLDGLDAIAAVPLGDVVGDADARSTAIRTLVALRTMRAALADFAELPHAA